MTAKAKTLKDFVEEHPLDRGRVEAHKERMHAEVRAYRMRDLSPALMSCTQARPALALSLVVCLGRSCRCLAASGDFETMAGNGA